MQDHSPITPGNETGASSNTSHEVILTCEQEAMLLFEKAKERLLNVNQWHELGGKGTAAFQLTDEKGDEVYRSVQLGDHFKIDIPGPGSVKGKGYDWVQVEAISHTKTDDKEAIAVRVRPADNPGNDSDDVAHFFAEEASSTFSVTRIGNKVIATVEGRNEKPNTQTGSIADKLRNTIVAAGAIIGLNKPQWNSLVKGLLS